MQDARQLFRKPNLKIAKQTASEQTDRPLALFRTGVGRLFNIMGRMSCGKSLGAAKNY